MNPIVDKAAGDNVNIWAGMNNEQIGGDDLLNQTGGVYTDPKTKILLAKYMQGQPTATQATGTDIVSSITTFVQNNPLLVLGGAALLAYMFMGGGSPLAERTVVTRYAKGR
jgi:hypothetical protein